jgi:hypothetical protein
MVEKMTEKPQTRMIFLHVFILLLMIMPDRLPAQIVMREPQEGMNTTTSDISGPKPLFELPKDIPSKPGAVTCHAHVPGISNGTIPIYLINRTDSDTSIDLIGSDINLKAHRKLANGKWERVQPANGWATCGDSFRVLAIPPGMFFYLSLACPPSGTPATLHYQFDNEWISNEFPGFFDPKARDLAQRDLKSPADCPTWAHILKLPLSDLKVPLFGVSSDLVDADLSPEQRFSWQAAAIDLLQQYADFYAARLACDDVLAVIHQLPKPVADTVTARFKLLKSRPSVAAASDLKFAARCLGYLRTLPDESTYGHPSQFPGMCWEALAWLAGNSPESAAMPWAEIFTLWKERLPRATAAELKSMAKLMESPRLANEHVPSEILISLLKYDSPALRENAVKRLLERHLDKDLAEAAAHLDEAGKSIVIRYVAADRDRFTRISGPLNDFLVASAKANPEATFEAIDKSSARDQPVNLDPELSVVFGDFFKKMVSVGLDGPIRMVDHRELDRIRRGMRYVQHVALLKKLTESQAYTASKEDSPVEDRHYFVAREARKQMIRLDYEF